jgi:BlaI family transcriptional regulator, penicillinase repressor
MTVRNATPRHAPGRLLTALQQAILDLLWEHRGATAEQVREGLLPAHRLKDSSIRTLLRRLEARGLVKHRLDGKLFVYEAKAAPQSVAARTIRQMIQGIWAGSAEQFLVGMIDEQVVTPEEIERLAKKVRGRK